MQPTSSPWRVLESPGEERATPASSEAAPEAGWLRPPRTAVVAIGIAGALLLLAFGLASQPDRGAVEVRSVASNETSAPSAAPTIVVEVAGAVVRPGLYTLPVTARVGDAITAAGGYGPGVDAEAADRALNLAMRLVDGARIRVPARGDAAMASTPSGPEGVGSDGSKLIDLNRATAAELESLPGIGPATAGKIVSARTEKRFVGIDDLVERKLVSAKVFEAIRGLVTVG